MKPGWWVHLSITPLLYFFTVDHLCVQVTTKPRQRRYGVECVLMSSQQMQQRLLSLCLFFTEMGAHQTMHGDGVKDIAFSVEDCRALYKVKNSTVDMCTVNFWKNETPYLTVIQWVIRCYTTPFRIWQKQATHNWDNAQIKGYIDSISVPASLTQC